MPDKNALGDLKKAMLTQHRESQGLMKRMETLDRMQQTLKELQARKERSDQIVTTRSPLFPPGMGYTKTLAEYLGLVRPSGEHYESAPLPQGSQLRRPLKKLPSSARRLVPQGPHRETKTP